MEDIIRKMNLLLADLQVERANLKAMHWNLAGCHSFLTIHRYFDELYEANGGHIDAIAEFIRIYRAVPIVSLSKYARRSSIEELTQESYYDISSCIDKAFVDANIILKQLTPLFDLTTTQLDIGDYMAVIQADYGKRLYFLRSSMKKEPIKMEKKKEEREEGEESEEMED